MSPTVTIQTSAGPEAFVVRSLEGTERVSVPFDLKVTCTAVKPLPDPASLLNQPAVVSFRGDQHTRYWHGIVSELAQGPVWSGGGGGTDGISSDPVRFWHLRLRPRLWFLSTGMGCEIFQNMSALDIVQEVLKRHGVTDTENKVCQAGQQERVWCVQYNESPLAFVSRLLEEEGIFYAFEHTAGKHTLVLGDHVDAFFPGNPDTLPFDGQQAVAPPLQAVHSTRLCQFAGASSWQSTDYAFQTPDTSLLVRSDAGTPGGAVYEYPGLYEKRSAGEKTADIRLEQHQCLGTVLQGESSAFTLSAGQSMTLENHPDDTMNRSWHVIQVVHTLVTSGSDRPPRYRNTFEAIPDDLVFRPPRTTPRPRIHGTQTAVVTGPDDEEIFMDEWGRIKVQFHWDQKYPRDDTSSCWVRVAQGWAGAGWGIQFIPRVGQEVVVTFLEGDPDRPLVTGSVYNGDNPLPYGPGHKTRSTIRSNDYKKGGGFNEMRMEDKKDKQEFFFHAERHHRTVVKRGNRLATLQAAEDKKVKDKLLIVKGDRQILIKEGHETHVLQKGRQKLVLKDGSRLVKVSGGDETHKNDQNFSHTVKQDYTLKIKGNLTIDVTGKVVFKAGETITMESGDKTGIKAGAALEMEAGADLKGKAGAGMTLEASAALTAKGGAMSTLQGGAGVTVKGPMVKIGS